MVSVPDRQPLQGAETTPAWPFGDLEPSRHFRVACADPGTRFRTRSAKGLTSRSPEKKYTTMSDEELMALPVRELMSRNSYLFFWETGPRLVKGLHLPIIRAWGYEPTAMGFVWIKLLKGEDGALFLQELASFWMGGGYTTRKNVEYCILCRRGSPPERKSKAIRELIFEPRRQHSRKPEQVYQRIEQYADGPYLDLFAGAPRPGWEAWGDRRHLTGSR